MKNILLTGGAGFIASNFYKKYRKYCDIKIVDNFNDIYNTKIKLKNLNLNSIPKYKYNDIYNVDILDFEKLKKIIKENNFDCIIHAAAHPGVRSSFKIPYDYYTNNAMGTLNLIELCKQYGIDRFIFLSSSSVYGKNNIPFNEDMEKHPISIYASSKDIAEDMLFQYHKHYNLNIIILRLFTVYGPYQRPDLMLCKFLSNAMNNRISEVYDIHSSRDYTYIDDAIRAIELAVDYSKHYTGYDVFNIGSGKNITMKYVLKIIKELIDNFEYIIKRPIKGDLKHTLADIRKSEKYLKYKPECIFENGVKELYKWLKDNYDKK